MSHALSSWKVRLFLMLSVADLTLTFWLLTNQTGNAYESNPIASGVLNQFGWLGMIVFKVCCVSVVLGIVILLGRLRPLISQRIMTFGCVALTCTVLYGASLATYVGIVMQAESIQSQRGEQLELRLQRTQEKLRAKFPELNNPNVFERRQQIARGYEDRQTSESSLEITDG